MTPSRCQKKKKKSPLIPLFSSLSVSGLRTSSGSSFPDTFRIWLLLPVATATPSPGRHRSAPAQPPSWSRWLPPSPSCTPLLTASRETLLKCKSDQTASRLNTLQGLPLYLKSNPTSYPASWLWLPSLTSPGPSSFHICCSSHSGLLACFLLPTVPGAVQPVGL